jgi:hypothetical protein
MGKALKLVISPPAIEDISIFNLASIVAALGYQVGRKIAFVELHPFHNFKRGLDRLGSFGVRKLRERKVEHCRRSSRCVEVILWSDLSMTAGR